MPSPLRALVVLAALAALSACPLDARCDPAACKGCCLSGVCVGGDEVNACGRGGFTCVDCAPTERGCQAGACVGDPAIEGRDCSRAITLDLSSGQAVASGDTRGGGEAIEASCGGGGAPERVYLFNTAETTALQVEVRPADGALRPVVSVRRVCEAAVETAPGCVGAAAAGEGAALTVRDLPAGAWFIAVDGLDGTAGAFTLNVARQTLGAETCTSPLPLNFPAALATTLKGTLAGATNDAMALCGGSGPDLAYRFATGKALNLDLELVTAEPAMQPVVYLRSICSGAEQVCGQAAVVGGPVSVQALELPPGTHHLWVDSATPAGGPFELRARLALPPVGASCLNPEPLVFDGGAAHVQGDTAPLDGGFARGASGSCGGQLSGERVYRFVTPGVRNLTATVTASPADGGQIPLLYLRRGGCAGNERACLASPGVGAAATLALGNLPADTWYLFVDGVTAAQGQFDLEVRLDAPIPGDACATALPLAFADAGTHLTAQLAGTTAGLFDDGQANCDPQRAPDAVYTFEVTALASLSATATAAPDSGFRPLLALRQGSCLSAFDRGCAAAPVGAGAATLTAGSLLPGQYQLWVDGAGGTAGDFTLAATLVTPPPGESCANAEDALVALGQDGGTLTVSGTLAGYASDSTGQCGGANGPDRAYRFTTTEPMNLRAELGVEGGALGVLYLRSYSCTSGERGCAVSALADGGTLLEVGSLPVANHWLWVDSASPDAGAFSLTATLSPPALGDACPAPRPLVLSDGVDGGSATVAGDTRLLFGHTQSCAGTGPDEVYVFTLAVPRVVQVQVAPQGGAFQPAVSLRSFCTSSSSSSCAVAPAAGSATGFTVNALQAGTWYLWVDGANQTRGAYTLSLDAY